MRDARRLRRLTVEINQDTGEIDHIEVGYTLFSSTDEQTQENPGGVVSTHGANVYRGANAKVLKARIFKDGTKAEIEARLLDDIVDEDVPKAAVI